MERIAAEGRGVILYLRRDGRGLDLFSPADGDRPAAPSTRLGSWLMNFREFGIGAQILRDVGVGKIRWLTNHPLRLISLPGYGLESSRRAAVARRPAATEAPSPAAQRCELR